MRRTTGYGHAATDGDSNEIAQTFKRLVRRAGIDHCTFLDLRKTACNDLMGAGVPDSRVQRFLGHAPLSTTRRYCNRVDQHDLEAAVERRYSARRAKQGEHRTGTKDDAE